jgi:hypothetical protein
MDALLESLSAVSLQLLPILGVALLVYLLIILKRVLDLLKKVDKTIDQVDLTLKKIEGPIDTVVKISNTIDFVNSAAENAVKALAIAAAKNFSSITAWIKQMLGKKKESDLEETTEEELGL